MMEKDKSIEQLFNDFNPDLGSSDVFMEQLNKKLDRIEYIKQMQEQQIKHYRFTILLSFVLGLISGFTSFAIVYFFPDALPELSLNTDLYILNMITENSRLFFSMGISLTGSLLTLTVINIVNSFSQIKNYRLYRE